LQLDPQRMSARRERSLAHMALGRLRDAWPEYEACAAPPPLAPAAGEPPSAASEAPTAVDEAPPWNGEWLEHKTILIRAERQIAEQFLYATTFGEIIAEAGHCLIECDERIAGLFARAFPAATICPLDPFEQTLGKLPPQTADFHLAAVSAIKSLRSERARFLRRPPAFTPAPELHRRMQRRLAALPPGVRIGVARGDGQTPSAARNSAAMWRSLFAAAPAVQFVDLRLAMPDVWPTGFLRSTICGSPPAGGNLAIDNLHDSADFAKTRHWDDIAALLAELDLVIAEDGPVWPLAGLLGVSTWVLCPHAPLGPQWLADAQGRSLWCPSVQIFHPKRLGDLGDLARQTIENLSRRYSGAVDLSEMGKPAGPHWLMSPAIHAAR
jgi:hypothetical protein